MTIIRGFAATSSMSAVSITKLSFLLVLVISATSTSTSVTPSGGSDGGGVVFSVNYKFAGMVPSLKCPKSSRQPPPPSDASRRRPALGRNCRPDSVGLYYAKIGIGTPSKDYYVQVDTGSDIMWVNCIECTDCPKRGYHGLELTLYDPKASLTEKMITCDHEFCLEINGGPVSGCKSNISCFYTELYGDGGGSIGYFVKDVVQYDRVSGDLETKSANGSVIFGMSISLCGARQSGDLGSPDEALDGILGFGKSNSSLISQLASSGNMRKMFAHCLDGVNGGGIFAIGHVVQPIVNTTPLVPNQPHYNVNMTAVEVGRDFLNLTTDVFEFGNKKGTIIDSGTTLAYLPAVIYEALVRKIFSWQPDLKLRILHEQYTCFQYSESIDDSFPPVTFHFEGSLLLTVYPREYLFPFEGLWCIGWQNSGMQSRDRYNMTLLGDLVLSNKLVLYDLEKQVIGWTEYNCSSSIKLKDEMTGSVHLVGAHSLSSAWSLSPGRALIFLLIVTALLHSSFY